MPEPGAAALAEALAAAPGDGALADLARAEAENDGTGRLRAAIDLLRAAARGEAVGVPAPDPEALPRITRLVRRDEALEALYEAEARGGAPVGDGREPEAASLAQAVWAERAELDLGLGAAATDWRVERMAAVDRAILRLALWELRHRPELPAAVIISEAVRLAKAYSTARSGAFVNGVLARLERERAAGE